MLQQTQVETVIPYYLRFLKRFPSLQSLATAPLERVLELWSGLGYYRRARNLHEAARVIVEKFDGHFPSDYSEARSLAGVGDYTARAVLSIAFNQPYAVMDGNVARVIARSGGLKGRPSGRRFRRAAERELERLISRRHPGDFNQALMELGQTVCLPRAPRCTRCPLCNSCAARRLGQQEAYPLPNPRAATEQHHLAAAVIRRRGRIALVRGLDQGLLGDLWNFPSAFGRSRLDARRQLEEKLEALAGRPVRLGTLLGQVRHNITFRSIRVHFHAADLPTGIRSLRWLAPEQLPKAAVSKLARKIFEEL